VTGSARLAALFVAGCSLVGCSFVDAVPEPVANTCSIDSDCPSNRCEPCTGGGCEGDGMCVSPAPREAFDIAVQVIPSSDPGTPSAPSWTTSAFEITGPTNRDLSLPSHAQVVGQVRWQGAPVPAEIVLTRPGLPGRSAVTVRTTTFASPQVTADGEEIDFSARVALGHEYQIEVRPAAVYEETLGTEWFRMLPPMRGPTVDLRDVEPNAEGAVYIVPLSMAFPEDLQVSCGVGLTAGCKLVGRVVSQLAGEVVPEQNLQVRVVEAETETTVSSTALSQEDGSFELFITPGAGEWLLKVTGGEERPLFPNVTVDPALLFGGEALIEVPRPQEVVYSGTVFDSSDEPVVNAAVRFVSEEAVLDGARGLTGSFRASAITDERGDFAVDLLPGTYGVVITPTDNRLAVTTDSVIISESAGTTHLRGQNFTLPDRATLGGTVETADERMLPGVLVEAVALGRPGGEDVSRAALYNRSSDAQSYETGLFELRVDVGSYDLFFKPPAESRFGWLVVPGFEVGSVGATLVNRYLMEPPVPLRGVVRGADGVELRDAELRVFGRVEDEDGEERYVELGTTRSDETGTYELLLPPAL